MPIKKISKRKFIFVSRPTQVGEVFEHAYGSFENGLTQDGFITRRLGRSDYSRKAPLRAVMDIIGECCGAIILGYPQTEFRHEIRRSTQVREATDHVFPTPWNQIEGALAYKSLVPVLVVAHTGISGGVFDHGVTGEGVLHVDLSKDDWFLNSVFSQPYLEWKTDVNKCLKKAR